MAKRMVSIPHFTQATDPQIDRLFATGNVEFSEKIDGSNVSFGFQDDKLYIKTKKGNPVFDDSSFIELKERFPDTTDIQDAFARLLKELSDPAVQCTLREILNSIPNVENMQVFGEMVHNSTPNIISYSKEDVKNGTIVLFLVTDGVNPISSRDMCKIIYLLSNIELKTFTMQPKHLYSIDISAFAEEWGSYYRDAKEFKYKRVDPRKVEYDKVRTNLVQRIQDYMVTVINGNWSCLGANRIEGIVAINHDTKQMIKFVDLDEFAKERSHAWAGVDLMKKHRVVLFKDLVSRVFNNADILLIKAKQEQKVIECVTSIVDLDDVYSVILADIANDVGSKTVALQCFKTYMDSLEILLKEDISEKSQITIANEIKFNQSTFNQIAISDTFEKDLISFLIGTDRIKELYGLIRSS